MIDFLGQEVKVGDYVVCHGDGAEIVFGIVEKITQKKAKITYLVPWAKLLLVTKLRDHNQVYKAINTDSTSLWETKRKALHQALIARMDREMGG